VRPRSKRRWVFKGVRRFSLDKRRRPGQLLPDHTPPRPRFATASPPGDRVILATTELHRVLGEFGVCHAGTVQYHKLIAQPFLLAACELAAFR